MSDSENKHRSKGRPGVLKKRISSTHKDQGEVRELIAELARKYGYPYETIREVIFSPYDCLRTFTDRVDTANPATFFELRIKYLGKFIINKKYVRHSRRVKGLPPDP